MHESSFSDISIHTSFVQKVSSIGLPLSPSPGSSTRFSSTA